MFWILKYFWVFATAISLAGTPPDSVRQCTARAYKSQVWRYITNNLYSDYIRQIESIERDLQSRPSGFAPFDEAAIIAGRKKLLSLGEGGANFIFTLLDHQEYRANGKNFGNIHAVDAAYSPENHAKFNLQALITRNQNRIQNSIENHQTQFPDNYHGQLFQELDLKNPDGSRMLFDEIVSYQSLHLVLKQLTTPVLQTEQILEIFTRISEHLEPGGRLWLLSESDHTNMAAHLQPILQILENQKIFSKIRLSDNSIILVK